MPTDEPILTDEQPLLTDQERAQRLADLTELIDLIRPAVQADGGDLVLVSADVETGVVEVQLQGSCSSCAISATTLQAGVERILTERLDWVSEVFGGVDEDIDWETSSAMGRGGYTPGF
jgi:Fe-S cluster biogenesis protein NfuA